jgi:hypothetical protein
MYGEDKPYGSIVLWKNCTHRVILLHTNTETINGARAPWWPFKKMKTTFKCFKKFETKNVDVDNVGMYEPVKSQFKIHCNLG